MPYQAITTKYHGPTDCKGSRVSASAKSNRVTLSWDSGLDSFANHKLAAQTLATKLNWFGPWVAGDEGGSGYVFVCTKNADGFEITEEPRLKAWSVHLRRSGAIGEFQGVVYFAFTREEAIDSAHADGYETQRAIEVQPSRKPGNETLRRVHSGEALGVHSGEALGAGDQVLYYGTPCHISTYSPGAHLVYLVESFGGLAGAVTEVKPAEIGCKFSA